MTDPLVNWSYGDNPAASSRDAMRFLIGDTDPADKKLTDSEIAFLVAEEPNIYFAASAACRSLAARYSNLVSKSVGDLSITYGERQKHYADLATYYRTRGVIRGASIYASGLTKAEVDAERENTSRVPRAFEVGMDDDRSGGDRRINLTGDEE